ncbi:MAG: hypothetical protein ACR2G0_04080 [Chthoniobacterales bacterium]
MPSAAELLSLNDLLWLWQAYDPAVKSDLYSTAVKAGATLFLIDPISLEPAPRQQLFAAASDHIVLLTNANHLRAAADFAAQFKAAVFASTEAGAAAAGLPARAILDGEQIASGVTAIAIEGAAPGEIVFHFAENGGTLVVGDALINFEPYGFTFLPPKYCSDPKAMRRSLRGLLDFSFNRMLFAHGIPIMDSARQKLETLLA